MNNPMSKPLRDWQDSHRQSLGCQLGTSGAADVGDILSTPIDQFSGNTLETLIRDLYDRERNYADLKAQVSELRWELAELEAHLKKRDKLLRWCAKRIRRMMRLISKGAK